LLMSTLARIARHSSIAMSYRYVHPSKDSVLDAMAMLGGHKTGHSEENEAKQEPNQVQEANETSAA